MPLLSYFNKCGAFMGAIRVSPRRRVSSGSSLVATVSGRSAAQPIWFQATNKQANTETEEQMDVTIA